MATYEYRPRGGNHGWNVTREEMRAASQRLFDGNPRFVDMAIPLPHEPGRSCPDGAHGEAVYFERPDGGHGFACGLCGRVVQWG